MSFVMLTFVVLRGPCALWSSLRCGPRFAVVLASLWSSLRCGPRFASDHPAVTNMKGKTLEVTRFLIGYADDLMMKVISKEEAAYAIEKLGCSLARAGLQINQYKTGAEGCTHTGLRFAKFHKAAKSARDPGGTYV